MAGIVERLKTSAAERREQFGDSKDFDLLDEAADAIERLYGKLQAVDRLMTDLDAASTAINAVLEH